MTVISPETLTTTGFCISIIFRIFVSVYYISSTNTDEIKKNPSWTVFYNPSVVVVVVTTLGNGFELPSKSSVCTENLHLHLTFMCNVHIMYKQRGNLTKSIYFNIRSTLKKSFRVSFRISSSKCLHCFSLRFRTLEPYILCLSMHTDHRFFPAVVTFAQLCRLHVRYG